MAGASAPYSDSATDEQMSHTVGTGQLVQLRVPLAEAADAFAQPDVHGRTPIVIVPLTASRVYTELLVAGLAVIAIGLLVLSLIGRPDLMFLVVLIGLALIVVAVWRAFKLQVPEGTTALLTRGGRHAG